MKDLKKPMDVYRLYVREIQSSQNNDMIELLHYGDVLVDGRFEIEEKDLTLPFRWKLQSTYYSIEKSKRRDRLYE